MSEENHRIWGAGVGRWVVGVCRYRNFLPDPRVYPYPWLELTVTLSDSVVSEALV